MASVASFTANANWFAVGPKSVTASWAAGDVIVVFGAAETAGTTTLNTPTATGLTFTQRAVNDVGANTEAETAIWTAVAGSSGSGVTVQLTDTSGAIQIGLAVWVISSASGSFTALAGTNTEAAYGSVTVGSGDVVIVALADFTAQNPPGKAPLTGSGTATERFDTGNGTNYAVWGADWAGTAAGTFTFGPDSYTALQVSQVGLVVANGGPTIPVLEQTRYRFGADDGNEAAHTFTAAENTGVTLAAAVPQLLRIQLDETAGVATSPRLAIQYKRTDEAATEWRNLTT